MTASSRKGGSDKILDKLAAKINAGEFYEAHQLYKTLYFRYKVQNVPDKVIELLCSGSKLLLQKQQITSGADLAVTLSEYLKEAKAPVTGGLIENISELFRLMGDKCEPRDKFASIAVRWTKEVQPDFSYGNPDLHQSFACTLWKERNYAESRHHFIRSQDGFNCAAMLIEYSIEKGYPSEVDLFIVQAVFQYLCQRNKTTASIVFKEYTDKHPHVDRGPPYLLPLLNFVWLLLIAIESGKLALFSILCERYRPSIERDPGYFQYLDRIGQLFFGVPPPRQTTGFGDIFSSLMQVDESAFSDEEVD